MSCSNLPNPTTLARGSKHCISELAGKYVRKLWRIRERTVLAAENITDRFTENKLSEAPAGIEIAFTSEDVEGEFAKAVKAGATVVREPVTKPWGQVVGYVRDLNGVIVEIGSQVK